MYKEDLALNIRQWLICHKTKPNQTKPNGSLSAVTNVDVLIYGNIFDRLASGL